MFINLRDFGGDLVDELRRLDWEMGGRGWPLSSIRSGAQSAWPPINIGSTQDEVDVYLFLPGIDPSSLDVQIQQNLLTIAGERRLISEAGASYFRKERHNGDFRRAVTLPEDVDPDRVEARYEDGVLQVRVMRRESSKPRQITIS
jgi:HSP20 family protein